MEGRDTAKALKGAVKKVLSEFRGAEGSEEDTSDDTRGRPSSCKRKK